MDEQPPDGSAATLYTTISSIRSLATPVFASALMLCGGFPGGVIFLCLITWVVWRSTVDAHRSSQVLLRGALGATLLGTMLLSFTASSFPASIGVALGLWLVLWLLWWRFVRRRTAAGSDIRRTLDRGLALPALSLLLGTLSALALLVSSEVWVMAMLGALLLGTLSIRRPLTALLSLWPLPETTPEELLFVIEARLSAEFGLTPAPWPSGLRMAGPSARVDVDLATAPASVKLCVPLKGLPGLRVRARRPGDVGGGSADPLLGRLLFVEGAGEGLLEGLHEELLGVLHAWPGSRIADGMLTVEIPGPPFDAARVGEPPLGGRPTGMGDFLARRLDEALVLAQVLGERGERRKEEEIRRSRNRMSQHDPTRVH